MELSEPLHLTDAVAAIILDEGGRCLMQLRDNKLNIPYPGHWGLFGGALEVAENPEKGMRRELMEELAFKPRSLDLFTVGRFDLSSQGLRCYERWIYLAPLNGLEMDGLVLREGAGMRLFPIAELLDGVRVTSYDAYALWLYANRHHFLP